MKTKFGAGVGALIVSLGLATAPQATAVNGWVSVAWSNGENHVHWHWGYFTKAATDAAALSDCRTTGGDVCKILASGTPCVAILNDYGEEHWGVGATREDAVKRALASGVDPSVTLSDVHCFWD